MHDIISFLRDAVTRGPAATGTAGCYVVRDGAIYARNLAMQAGIPWPSKKNFTIPATALDEALARIKEVKTIKVNDDTVVIGDGRMRSTIQRVHDEPPPLPDFPDEYEPCPPGLAEALKKAKPFVGDRQWQQGVCVLDGRLVAFSGHAGVEISFGIAVGRQRILTIPVVDFLIAQGDPDEFAEEENAVIFRWEDGRWMRAQLLNEEMPESMIEGIFTKVGDEAATPMGAGWKEALSDAAALSNTTVRLSIEGFQGKKENVVTDVAFPIDVPPDHTSYWHSDHLAAVLEVAEAWNPLAYPEPAFFKGKNVRGVICGYRS